MSGEHERVLVLNPGTTSTKFGIFTRAGEELARNIHHGDDEIERFRGRPMLDRLEYRAGKIEAALAEAGFTPKGQGTERWAAVAGRGGLLPPMECGTYLVDDAMVEELRQARRGEHASNLGAVLAAALCAGGRRERLHRRSGDGGRVAGLRAASPVRRW